jgi:misacylated tRNA(Ala) deacylase
MAEAPAPHELFSADAYCRSFDATIAAVDPDEGRVALDRTAFYPTGGGQPHDLGTLTVDGDAVPVTRVARDRDTGTIWHWLDTDRLPAAGSQIHGDIDWERRYLLMRTHSALHVLCGVIWADYGVAVTGGNMEPGSGRLDFELDQMSVELGKHIEGRINEEIDRAHDIRVEFVPRASADEDPALVRTKANLIPRHIDPLRVIDIVGLDRQADGGTHVANTSEIGRVEVTKAESKGKANKRIRLAVHDT